MLTSKALTICTPSGMIWMNHLFSAQTLIPCPSTCSTSKQTVEVSSTVTSTTHMALCINAARSEDFYQETITKDVHSSWPEVSSLEVRSLVLTGLEITTQFKKSSKDLSTWSCSSESADTHSEAQIFLDSTANLLMNFRSSSISLEHSIHSSELIPRSTSLTVSLGCSRKEFNKLLEHQLISDMT